MKNYFFILFAIVVISSCKKSNTDNNNNNNVTPPPAVVADTLMNVAYGSDPAQVMDIYRPANRSADSTKVMIMIHGGAWSSGDKTDFNTYITTLKQRLPNYTLVNMNYRLANPIANAFPTQENDVLSALTYLYNHSSQLAISNKYVLLGASAGGQLSLLQAYKRVTPVAIKAVVDFFGPTDMVDLYNYQNNTAQTGMQLLMGGTPASNPSMYQQSSPKNYVSSTSCPTIILQGGMDAIVPPHQSADLSAQLTLLGIANQYVYFANEVHGTWTNAHMDSSFNAITSFVLANVH